MDQFLMLTTIKPPRDGQRCRGNKNPTPPLEEAPVSELSSQTHVAQRRTLISKIGTRPQHDNDDEVDAFK